MNIQNVCAAICTALIAAIFFYIGYLVKVGKYISRISSLEEDLKKVNSSLEMKEEIIKILKQEVRRLKDHTKGLEAVVEDYNDRYVMDSKRRKLV